MLILPVTRIPSPTIRSSDTFTTVTVEFLPQARTEWVEAIPFYNEQRSDLGFEFALEVDRTLERIVQYPHAWTLIAERTRRALVDRFPYGILYYVHADSIVVTAVMNLRQRPRSPD